LTTKWQALRLRGVGQELGMELHIKQMNYDAAKIILKGK
jgi:hypothetical protein